MLKVYQGEASGRPAACRIAATITSGWARPNLRVHLPVASLPMISSGECDHLPEQAFYMVGTIDEAFEKAKKLAAG